MPTVSSYPHPTPPPKKKNKKKEKQIIFLNPPPPAKNSKFEPLKMARAYVYLKVSEYPPPAPWTYALFPCPLQRY